VTESIRVVLIEDNEVFRDALELLLGLQSGVEVVASLADGSEAVGIIAKLRPHVVVVDYRLPGLDGVQLTDAIRFACPEVAVICLSASASEREVEALRAAGAFACLTKDEPLDDILAAIRGAAAAAAA
jgi:DNA-binding NarL/FixJ family response regulator